MKKPNNYDNVSVGGDFVPVELGAHYGKIMSVKEQISKNGKDMIVVAIDFDKRDEQAAYFSKQFEEDIRADKKWPYTAIQYILCTDSKGVCNRSFKSFTTCYEKSNGKEVDWDAKDFCRQFKGKKIGVVFGEVEEEYNGETKIRRRIRWFCDFNKVDEQKIPAVKYLPSNGPAVTRPEKKEDEFVDVDTEEIPF